MQLDVTNLIRYLESELCSGSVAELGDDAAKITWNNALDEARSNNLLDDDEKRQAFRDYVKGFGAWDDEEINSWSDYELNALLIQLISGDIRESEALSDCCDLLHDGEAWRAYQAESEAGQVSGRLFRVESTENEPAKIYYHIGY